MFTLKMEILNRQIAIVGNVTPIAREVSSA